jgi:hypothetical protein
MKAYIVLGMTGSGVFKLKDILKVLLNKDIQLETTDNMNFSSTKLEFEVATPEEARELIEKAFRWLTQHPWYHDDSKLSFTVSGLLDNEGLDWTCDFCGGDLDECECKAMKEVSQSQ